MGRTTIPPECILERWTTNSGKELRIIYSKPLPAVDSVNKRHAKLFMESNHHDQIAAQTETGMKKGLKRIRKSTKIGQDDFAKETEKGLDEEETEKDLEEDEPAKINEEYNISDPKKIQSKAHRKAKNKNVVNAMRLDIKLLNVRSFQTKLSRVRQNSHGVTRAVY